MFVSYQMGSWKCVRNVIAKDLKLENEAADSSMNHFVMLPVRVLGNIRNLIESSKN